jgi:hypothetical protein
MSAERRIAAITTAAAIPSSTAAYAHRADVEPCVLAAEELRNNRLHQSLVVPAKAGTQRL